MTWPIAMMAPRRLRRWSLRDRAQEKQGWRWALIRKTPTVAIDYLLEILLATICLLTASAYFAGLTQKTSVIRLVPDWLAALWGVVLALGSFGVFLGLAMQRYGTVVAYGMRLLGLACMVYAASAWWYVGLFNAMAPILMSTVFGVLALWRGFILYSTYLYLSERTSGASDANASESA